MVEGLKQYHADVKAGTFPAKENTYPINEAELARFFAEMTDKKADNDAVKMETTARS
jgi:hypothetical protein